MGEFSRGIREGLVEWSSELSDGEFVAIRACFTGLSRCALGKNGGAFSERVTEIGVSATETFGCMLREFVLGLG